MKVIYDLGSNNGDDLEYYLLKADRVVAVEANPDLCKIIETRFSREIADSRLFVENCAITDKEADNVDFYIHQRYHFLGSLIPPEQNSFDWRKISIGALPLHHLISKHGQPYYIKIDLEGCDELALHALLNCNTKPQYISAESHTIGVFALLAEKLGYRSFKLVDGHSVDKAYSKKLIYSPVAKCLVEHSFPRHSAGPFGDDIDGDWLDKTSLLRVLAMRGLGWIDIHATNEAAPTSMGEFEYWTASSKRAVSTLIQSTLRKIKQATKLAS